jgi:hypothetical protein
MTLFRGGASGSQWDEVMFQIARWLTRHLNDPALVLWLVKYGARLHDGFVQLIDARLDQLTQFEHENNASELARIRADSPNAIPRPAMRVLWRLILAERVKSPSLQFDLYRWRKRFKRDGLTTALRLELRKLLTPCLLLRKPLLWGEERKEPGDSARVSELIGWEIVLAADYVHQVLKDLAPSDDWRAALPDLLDDVQQLTLDALNLMRDLGDASDQADRSHWDLPSVSPHWQNRGFRDWVALIDILRDAWVCTRERDPSRAQRIASAWWTQRYPTFKRLALYAATHADIAPNGEWVDWLLGDDAWWLWSVETQRETMRVIVLRAASLPAVTRERVEIAIVAGPPRRMFRDSLEPDQWAKLVSHTVWLRLAKLASSGAILGVIARSRFDTISAAHPEWRIAADESDEFSHWMIGSGDPGYDTRTVSEQVPRQRRALVEWLQRPAPEGPFFAENDWAEICRKKMATAVCALYSLLRQQKWPIDRWREALQVWSEDKLARRAWRYAAPMIQQMPDEILLQIGSTVSWWLDAVSKLLDRNEPIFFELCNRLLRTRHGDAATTDAPVTQAINHPVGQITQALLNRWFTRHLEDAQGLPEELKAIFTALTNVTVDQYRHARVLLANNVIALFRVDMEWTTDYLLPLFNWQRSRVEARSAWEGFLWSPRLYLPLFVTFKEDFLETARHYEELGEHGRQYAAILTYAALDPIDTFTSTELYEATNALPQTGLQECAHALVNALESAGEQREEYFMNRIQRYWHNVWPKSRDLASGPVGEELARLAIAARGAFPTALGMVRDWMQPTDHSQFITTDLSESNLCDRYPQDALTFLDVIINYSEWVPPELRQCLDAISRAWPEVDHDQRYRRLDEYARRRG